MDQVFSFAGLFAMAGWVLLSTAPLAGGWAERVRQVGGIAIPALLALAYLVLIIRGWGDAPGGFGSLAEVRSLFSDDGLLTAGWIHYLAFDLFVGGWIARDGTRRGVPHLLLIPCFVPTFLFGPIGFLLFLAVRATAGRWIEPRSAAIPSTRP